MRLPPPLLGSDGLKFVPAVIVDVAFDGDRQAMIVAEFQTAVGKLAVRFGFPFLFTVTVNYCYTLI